MASSATFLVSGMRQNTQLVLAFPVDGREGTEPRAAGRRDESPAINDQWMERACERDNCKQALARVRGNRGSPGVDGMTVGELPGHLREHWPTIRKQLLSGTSSLSWLRSVRTVLLPWPLRLLPLPRPAGSIVPVIAQMGGQFRLQGALHDGLLQVRQQSFAAQQVLRLVVALEQLREQLPRYLFHRCAPSVDCSTYPLKQ